MCLLVLMVLCPSVKEDRSWSRPHERCNQTQALNEGLALQIQPDLSAHCECLCETLYVGKCHWRVLLLTQWWSVGVCEKIDPHENQDSYLLQFEIDWQMSNQFFSDGKCPSVDSEASATLGRFKLSTIFICNILARLQTCRDVTLTYLLCWLIG